MLTVHVCECSDRVFLTVSFKLRDFHPIRDSISSAMVATVYLLDCWAKEDFLRRRGMPEQCASVPGKLYLFAPLRRSPTSH